MKIIFLCSSLEPGRDGAGDQARSLAGELIRQGHQVSAVSLKDHEFPDPKKENQDAEGIALPVLRIPSSWKSKRRYKLMSDWIKEFNPDWVSLQFVSFGYHRYGLPWKMLLRLRPAIGNARLNIMFHELWCGMGANPGIKERVLGAVQKRFIKIMLNRLRPESVFTSIPFYATKLKRLGIIGPGMAPVFGNISLNDWPVEEEWTQLAYKVGLESVHKTSGDWLVISFFGTVYPCASLQQLLVDASNAATEMDKKLGILVIGHGRGWDIRSIAKTIPGTTYWQTGSVSPAMINRAMSLVDMGVVTTPALALNKSSTANAWLERGIPILISQGDQTYCKSEMEPNGIYQVRSSRDVLLCLQAKGKFSPKNRFAEVSATYNSLAI